MPIQHSTIGIVRKSDAVSVTTTAVVAKWRRRAGFTHEGDDDAARKHTSITAGCDRGSESLARPYTDRPIVHARNWRRDRWLAAPRRGA
jgi:hypothetical protein